MANKYWAVVEVFESNISQVIHCKNQKDGQEAFKKIVSDYDVEITDENYDEAGQGKFESEDGCLVQLVKCN
jgi:hypothetical protein